MRSCVAEVCAFAVRRYAFLRYKGACVRFLALIVGGGQVTLWRCGPLFLCVVSLLLGSFFERVALYLGDNFAAASYDDGYLAMVQVNGVANDGGPQCLYAKDVPLHGSVTCFVHFGVKFRSVEVQLVASDRRGSVCKRYVAFFVQFAPAFCGTCAFCPVLARRAGDVVFGWRLCLVVIRRALLRSF